ncbi:SCO family protein [Methylocystis parvus]|uniref:SCO family protein n=1 Tax=Methylocystis parvus TaxID=134 RepID=A0A6B8M6T8_9HYPH|nr:SCO family protein [Methylocystis parvus]QGM98075.1 SCO family protein [Methylocystis parvus]WBK01606.1 SCO family protein [Methylocystis parvus OBBP]
MTEKRKYSEGARAPFAALTAMALAFAAPSTPMRAADAAHASVANLPSPGTYVLQRIQRVPSAKLLDAEGRSVDLSAKVAGAVTALGFIYGHCEDAAGCPVAWSIFEEARKAAAAEPLLADRLRLVFVSLDPARDTPAVLRLLEAAEQDAAAPPWIFLTGKSEADIAPLLRAMGQDIGYERDAAGRRTGAINHMLKVFLIDPEGWVREIYSTAFLTPDNLLNDARTLALAFGAASNGKREP